MKKNVLIFIMIVTAQTTYVTAQEKSKNHIHDIKLNDRYHLVVDSVDKNNTDLVMPVSSEYLNFQSLEELNKPVNLDKLKKSYEEKCKASIEKEESQTRLSTAKVGNLFGVVQFHWRDFQGCTEPLLKIYVSEHNGFDFKTDKPTLTKIYSGRMEGGFSIKTNDNGYYLYRLKLISSGNLTSFDSNEFLSQVYNYNTGLTGTIVRSLNGPSFIKYSSSGYDAESYELNILFHGNESFSGEYDEIEDKDLNDLHVRALLKLRSYAKKYGKSIGFMGCGIPTIKWGNNNGKGPLKTTVCVVIHRK